MEAKSSSTSQKAVIITALQVEYEAVRRYLSNLSEKKYSGTIYEYGTFEATHASWKVGIVEIGAGNLSAALATERAINYFKPKVAMFVGVAGGIKDTRLGDVIAATKIYGYASGKADDDFLPRPDVGETSFPLQQRALVERRKINWLARIKTKLPDPQSQPVVLVGPIAAGEVVVSSTRSPLYQFLRKQYNDALAVEMEGRGFLEGIHANPEVMAMVVRGISDLLDDKEHTDAVGWQPIAASHAAAFAFQILAEYIGPKKRKTTKQPLRLLHQIPLPPSDFTGREQELKFFLDAHAAGNRLAYIRGMGGIGKTVFAFALAKALAQQYPDGQILIDLLGTSKQPLTPAQVMSTVIRILRPTETLAEDIEELSAIYRSVLVGKRIIILLDNARSQSQVEPLIPPDTCYLIVTSRIRFTLTGKKDRKLEPLLPQNAVELLLSIEERLGEDAGRLAELCGCVPLALRLSARALAEQPTLPVAEFMQKFEQIQPRLKIMGMGASLQLSYNLLEPDWQIKLAHLSIFTVPFDRNTAAAVWNIDQDTSQIILDNLYNASLLDGNTQTGFHLPNLVHAFASGELSSDDRRIALERLAANKRKLAGLAESAQNGLTVSST